jgi:hypothetical protein
MEDEMVQTRSKPNVRKIVAWSSVVVLAIAAIVWLWPGKKAEEEVLAADPPQTEPTVELQGTPMGDLVAMQEEFISRFENPDIRELNPRTLTVWAAGWVREHRPRWEALCQHATEFYLEKPEHRIRLYAAAKESWTRGEKRIYLGVDRWNIEVDEKFGDVIRAHEAKEVEDETKRPPLDPSIPRKWTVAQLRELEELVAYLNCPLTHRPVPAEGTAP